MAAPEQMEESIDEGRARRTETRVTRLMLALGVDPFHQYPLNRQPCIVDTDTREVLVANTDVTMLDMANAVMLAGGDLRLAWTIVLGERTMGQLTFAE